MVYTPVSHTLTIALSNFSSAVTARWYDPTANTYTAIAGSPFPNSGTHNFTTPGNNSAGDGDWVLVFETKPTPTPTPTPTATANHRRQPQPRRNANPDANADSWSGGGLWLR